MNNQFIVGDRVFIKNHVMSTDGIYGRIIAVDDGPIDGKPCNTVMYQVKTDEGKKYLCGNSLLVPVGGVDGCISRKELLDMLNKDPREAFTKHNVWTMIVYGLREVIPTYKPNKAEWRINSDGYYPYCSNCNKEPEGGKMTDYCPNCGAYMKCSSSEECTLRECDDTEDFTNYPDGPACTTCRHQFVSEDHNQYCERCQFLSENCEGEL